MVSGLFRGTMWNQSIPDALRGRLAGIEMLSYSSGPALGNVEAGLFEALAGLRVSIVAGARCAWWGRRRWRRRCPASGSTTPRKVRCCGGRPGIDPVAVRVTAILGRRRRERPPPRLEAHGSLKNSGGRRTGHVAGRLRARRRVLECGDVHHDHDGPAALVVDYDYDDDSDNDNERPGDDIDEHVIHDDDDPATCPVSLHRPRADGSCLRSPTAQPARPSAPSRS